MMKNKLYSGYLDDKSFIEFKSIVESLDELYKKNISNFQAYIDVEIPCDFEWSESKYEISDEWLDVKYNDNVEYLNDLIWIFLSKNTNFTQLVDEFEKLINSYNTMCLKAKNYDDIINPFELLELNEKFKEYIFTKTQLKFEVYRDNFYDRFGIDIVQYREYILYSNAEKLDENFLYTLNQIKNLDKYYPYKNIKLNFQGKGDRPLHRIIERHSVSIYISPLLSMTSIEDRMKIYYIKPLTKHINLCYNTLWKKEMQEH